MTAMLSGVIMIAAFCVMAAAGLILPVALWRITRRADARSGVDQGVIDGEGG